VESVYRASKVASIYSLSMNSSLVLYVYEEREDEEKKSEDLPR
jgi:hypothetical protein